MPNGAGTKGTTSRQKIMRRIAKTATQNDIKRLAATLYPSLAHFTNEILGDVTTALAHNPASLQYHV
jgi:hypothetical protein